MKTTGNFGRTSSIICVVDDDAGVRESLDCLLRSAGYKAQEYASAESYLTNARWEETACLIVDIKLPGMDGIELQRQLLEKHHEHTPIVFISGQATEAVRQQAIGCGALEFLKKPFDEEALLRAVRRTVTPEPEVLHEPTEFYFFGMPDHGETRRD